MTWVSAPPGSSLVAIFCSKACPTQHRPATAPLHGRNLSKVVMCMSSSFRGDRGPVAGAPNIAGQVTQPHDARVPTFAGTVPGTADTTLWRPHTWGMSVVAIGL